MLTLLLRRRFYDTRGKRLNSQNVLVHVSMSKARFSLDIYMLDKNESIERNVILLIFLQYLCIDIHIDTYKT